MYYITTLKSHASGRWPKIILSLAPHLFSMIERGRRHGPCPLCGGKDRARCHNDFNETGGVFCNQCGGGADGLAVLQWANGWTFPETVEAVCKHLDLADSTIPPLKPIQKPEPIPQKNWEVERERLQAIWDATEPDPGRIRQYLENRGLAVDVPPGLHLHPSLGYYHQGPPIKYPAMIACIQREGGTVGLHITYFDTDSPGKAPISQPRKIWKCVENISGGAVQLFTPGKGKPLVLCEGIETTLATREMIELPAWSCLNAGMLERVKIPEFVSEVIIAGDLDRTNRGQNATERLAKRLHSEGKRVKIALPPGPIPENSKSVDWLDVLMENREVSYV